MNKPTQQSVPWIFDVKALDLPDQDLGIELLSDWLRYQSEKRGVNPTRVTLEFAGKLRRSTAAIKDADLENPGIAPLLMALRLVARGEAAAGGALFRRHIHHSAVRIRNERDATKGRKAQAQRDSALPKGPKAAARAKEMQRQRNEQWLNKAIDKVTSSGIQTGAGIARTIAMTINREPDEFFPRRFFPSGTPYTAKTIARKVREIVAAKRKAAGKK